MLFKDLTQKVDQAQDRRVGVVHQHHTQHPHQVEHEVNNPMMINHVHQLQMPVDRQLDQINQVLANQEVPLLNQDVLEVPFLENLLDLALDPLLDPRVQDLLEVEDPENLLHVHRVKNQVHRKAINQLRRKAEDPEVQLAEDLSRVEDPVVQLVEDQS